MCDDGEHARIGIRADKQDISRRLCAARDANPRLLRPWGGGDRTQSVARKLYAMTPPGIIVQVPTLLGL